MTRREATAVELSKTSNSYRQVSKEQLDQLKTRGVEQSKERSNMQGSTQERNAFKSYEKDLTTLHKCAKKMLESHETHVLVIFATAKADCRYKPGHFSNSGTYLMLT